MITVREARALVHEQIPTGGSERISLHKASGRILREEICADRDAPPFDRVMMDGYALRAADWAEGKLFQRLAGVAAGMMPPARIAENQIVSVVTGGVLPAGCDAVVPVEWCTETEGVGITPPAEPPHAGMFVHRRGSDGLVGRVVLTSGIRLRAGELAVAATEGCVEVEVNQVPKVMILTTGSEIVPIDAQPGPTQLRGSHAVALSSLLQGAGAVDMQVQHVPDEVEPMRAAIERALNEADFLLLAGGVSKGKWDFVPELLEEAGVERIFHRVAQKPGRPLWFGAKGATTVFGLPGNPVSATVCARMYVVPALQQWMGEEVMPGLSGTILGLPEDVAALTRFLPLRLTAGGDWEVMPMATSGSLHCLVDTQAVVEIPAEAEKPALIHPWTLL